MAESNSKLQRVELAPREAGGARTLVLLHGFGADEHDLLPLAHELDPRLHAVSLRAPLSLEWGGRAWYNLLQTRDGFSYSAEEVKAADALVAAALAEIAASRGKLLVLGFSQGACMAMRATLAHPEHVAALVSLSGVSPHAGPGDLGDPALLRNLPAFVAHGLYDQLLPLSQFANVQRELSTAGLALEPHQYPMAHAICPEEVADLRAFLARQA